METWPAARSVLLSGSNVALSERTVYVPRLMVTGIETSGCSGNAKEAYLMTWFSLLRFPKAIIHTWSAHAPTGMFSWKYHGIEEEKMASGSSGFDITMSPLQCVVRVKSNVMCESGFARKAGR